MSDTPETDAAVKASNGQWSFVLKETCQRLERERDALRTRNQALETALAYSAEGQTLLSKFLQAVKDRDEARARADLLAEAIVSTLEGNRHLAADGENCTLAKLKTVVPHWK